MSVKLIYAFVAPESGAYTLELLATAQTAVWVSCPMLRNRSLDTRLDLTDRIFLAETCPWVTSTPLLHWLGPAAAESGTRSAAEQDPLPSIA